jgi:hypothetical protein
MDQIPKRPGVYKQIFSDDRRYAIYIPEILTENKEPTLIMLLHWGGRFILLKDGRFYPVWEYPHSVIWGRLLFHLIVPQSIGMIW